MAKRKKDKRTNNDRQSTKQKTKERATRTPQKTEGELRRSGRVGSSCSTSDTRRVTVVTNPVISCELRTNIIIELLSILVHGFYLCVYV